MKLKQFIPMVSKSALLLIAGVVWLLAGSILLYKGLSYLYVHNELLFVKLSFAFFGGFLFYYFLFATISSTHIRRIKAMQPERVPCYAFFNARSYLLMFGMIALGVFIRKSGWVSMSYLAPFYVTMATPLLLSAVRFFANYSRK